MSSQALDDPQNAGNIIESGGDNPNIALELWNDDFQPPNPKNSKEQNSGSSQYGHFNQLQALSRTIYDGARGNITQSSLILEENSRDTSLHRRTNSGSAKKEPHKITNGKFTYQMGYELGRGAFATVYQAFNVDTGDFVAVKRFPIKNIDSGYLAQIEAEIELMQKLSHPNIVKYITTIRSRNHLYIVLEYMENGSLSNVIKKFGSFSESLASIYITQVLKGLSYLHEQGVLHRDIKGANILTTKGGHVKLADFGVAVKLNETSGADEQEVVGSPYWIAPEIIEMSTPTAACDIWSVGCTTVELLTGKPPYYDLEPLAAMFRIVTEDYPPLPKGISQAVRDFLLQCFKKEPFMRPTAAKLLQHPWLYTQSPATLQESEISSSGNDLENSVANTIRLYRTSSTPALGISSPRTEGDNNHLSGIASPKSSNNKDLTVPQSPRRPFDIPTLDIKNSLYSPTRSGTNRSILFNSDLQKSNDKMMDFALPLVADSVDLSVSKNPVSVTQSTQLALKQFEEIDISDSFDDLQFEDIRPFAPVTLSLNGTNTSPPVPPLPIAMTSSSMLTFNNLNFNNLGNSNVNNNGLHLGGINIGNITTNGMGFITLPLNLTNRNSSPLLGTDMTPGRYSVNSSPSGELSNRDWDVPSHFSENTRNANSQSLSSGILVTTTEKLKCYQEKQTDSAIQDYSDDIILQDDHPLMIKPVKRDLECYREPASLACISDDIFTVLEQQQSRPVSLRGVNVISTGARSRKTLAEELNERMKRGLQQSCSFDESLENNALDNEFNEDDFLSNRNKDMHMKLAKDIVQLMSVISPECPEATVVSTCESLIQMFDEHPEQREYLIVYHGVMPILDMFEARSESSTGMVIRYQVLRVINKIIEGSVKAQEQLSLVGIIPAIMRVLENACHESTTSDIAGALVNFFPEAFYPVPVIVDPLILEAARFVHQISSTSLLTLQMLIGAGGLHVLVQMVAFGALILRPHPMKAMTSLMLHSINKVKESELDNFRKIHPFRFSADNTLSSLLTLSVQSRDAQRMVYMGIDCILQVFSVQSSRTRDFCRLFVKLGLLPHLSSAFLSIFTIYHRSYVEELFEKPLSKFNEDRAISSHQSAFSQAKSNSDTVSRTLIKSDSFYSNSGFHLNADESDECRYALSIATIMFNFSRSAAVVASHLSRNEKGSILHTILMVLQSPQLSNLGLDVEDSRSHHHSNNSLTSNRSTHNKLLSSAYTEIILLLLKCLRNLSMEPSILLDLEKAGTIETLVPILSGPIGDQCVNQILPCIYNLCRINRRRQELAATHGIIPLLQRVIQGESHLRQFALPIICNLAHTSAVTRRELWKHDGVSFYLNLLNENYWQSFALNSIATWLANDPDIVQQVLIQPTNLSRLIDFFRSASSQTIRSIHVPWLEMMLKSPLLCRSLSYSGLFLSSLTKRLQSSEAIVLCSLMKMVQLLHQYHPVPRKFVLDYDLYNLVRSFAQSEDQVLVYQVANRLLFDFQQSTFT